MLAGQDRAARHSHERLRLRVLPTVGPEARAATRAARPAPRCPGPGPAAVQRAGPRAPACPVGGFSGGPVRRRRLDLARAELALADASGVNRARERAVEASLRVGSTFERGLTELVAARAFARLGLPGDAAAHLLGAHELFEESGAKAWEHIAEQALKTPGFVARRRERDGEPGRRTSRPTKPATGVGQDAPGRRSSCGQWNGLLTERELDVARLVVQGRTNRQVAASLYVSVRTVEVHLGRVFRKLGVRSRTELAVLALRG